LSASHQSALSEISSNCHELLPEPPEDLRGSRGRAASIAALLITTEAMIAERPKKDATPAMPGGGMNDMDF
jgi:chaperonin GroEL